MNTRALDWRRERPLLATCALAFIASAWVTVAWCGSLCDMPGMGMWFRMPGQSRLDHFAMFEAMWLVMMVAMMMPVLVPALLRYRRAALGAGAGRARSTAVVAAGYFTVWTAVGILIYVLGVPLAEIIANVPAFARLATVAAGLLVMLAGALQFSRQKARQLECCRAAPPLVPARPATLRTAWRHGLRTGRDCVYCCAGLTATLLVIGVMDLWAMTLVAAATALERLTPRNAQLAKLIGVGLLVVGVLLCAGA
jgi:predicted metal-binding membrane protein